MLTLLLGVDWITNRDAVLSMIKQNVSNKNEGCILIVPELISHDMERRLCDIAGDTASRFAEVLTFSRLAQRVSEAVGCGMQPCLDNGGRLVAMAAAARQLHGRLKSYAAVESRPEFLSDLIDAIDEFKRCCISATDLMRASKQTTGVLAQKLEELSLLFDAYDGICQHGKRDPRDQMTWLLDQLEDSDFAKGRIFYIDGFPDFTRQHMAIISHLICNAKQVYISMNCDGMNSLDPSFEKAAQTTRELFQFAKRSEVDVTILSIPGRMDSLTVVRGGLFQGKVSVQPDLEQTVTLYRAKSLQDECLAAADRILDLVQAGTRYRDISIVCSDIATYQSAIDAIFERCHIPAYRSGTEAVLDKSAIITVLSAIDIAVGGFEQSDVFRFMKSILSPLDIHACDQVENYAIMWNIHGKRWQSQWVNHPKGLCDVWSEHDKQFLSMLNQYKDRIIIPLSHLQQGFREARNVREQVSALYDFLNEIGFARRMSDIAVKMDSVGDNRSAQIMNQIWEIMLSAMEQLYDLLGDTVWEAEHFARLFRLLLSQYDVGTIPPMLDAVTVGPVSAMRCQQSDHLIILGAVEGSFPGYGGSRGVLNDVERTELRNLGIPLTGGALEGVQAEFAEIYGVFCGAMKTISVSCPSGQPSSVYRRMLMMGGRETAVNTAVTSARADRHEAAAYLLRHGAPEMAVSLNLFDIYDSFNRKICFQPGNMEIDTVKALYGEKLNLSASQVDKQALCRMAYFLRYGMLAKERKTMTVDPAEFGTFVHAVLEQTVRDVMTAGGFHEVSLEKTLEIAEKYSHEYAAEHFQQLDSERLTYLFQRNRQELRFVVQELWDELRNSEFVPVGFEVGFGEDREIGAIQIAGNTLNAQLRGFVDRVDAWNQKGRTFFRIVDYKTGNKDFDYCDIYNGLGLQMLLYLFALEDNQNGILGTNPVAAGVQYFPARVPFILVDGIEDTAQIQDGREKAWKRKGLLLEDESVLYAMDLEGSFRRLCCSMRKNGSLSGDLANFSQFKMLRSYVFGLLGKIVDDIASGNVSPNPYTRGSSENACRFCPYGSVCHPANVVGRRNYKAITAQRFWEDVEKEVGKRG